MISIQQNKALTTQLKAILFWRIEAETKLPTFSLRFSFNFSPKFRINNITALVQIMAWRLTGDKPLSEPMMVSLLTHICGTWPQWVKSLNETAWGKIATARPTIVHAIMILRGGVSWFCPCHIQFIHGHFSNIGAIIFILRDVVCA